MQKTQIFIASANPLEVKETAHQLGELGGVFVTMPALAEYLDAHSPGVRYTIEGLRAFMKHTAEAMEGYVPGGEIWFEETISPQQSADEIVDSVRRTALWSPQTALTIPMNISGVEAAHILSRSGTSLIFWPVSNVDQVAVLRDATREATSEMVTVVVPCGELQAKDSEGLTALSGVSSFANSLENKMLVAGYVGSVNELIWALSQDLAIVIAPYEVLTKWLAAGQPQEMDEIDNEPTENQNTPNDVQNEDGDLNRYQLSNPVTDILLARSHEAWQSLLE